MNASHERGKILTTTETSLRVVETLKEVDGARVTELAHELDMAPSTVHNHLSTLLKHGYVTKEGDTYLPGYQFVPMSEFVRNRKQAYRVAQSKVHQLAEECGARGNFVIEDGGRGMYLFTATAEGAVKAYSRVGRRAPLHVTAAGKSILSQLPERRVDEIVETHGLPRETEHTITDRDALHEELAAIRERGYAYNCEEHLTSVNAVGAPVNGVDGRVVGAMSVSGPAQRLKGDLLEAEFPDVVLGITNELELSLTYSQA